MHRRVFLENVEIDSAEVDADVEFLTQAFSIVGTKPWLETLCGGVASIPRCIVLLEVRC